VERNRRSEFHFHSAKPFQLLSPLAMELVKLPEQFYSLPSSLSEQLNISVEDPNNNGLFGQKPKLISSDFNSNLLLSTNITQLNSTPTSVIVRNESVKLSSEIHRPIPTDQENFFANNPSILLNSINSINDASQIASHPRIAFRRISAPANLLSSQLNTFVANNVSLIEVRNQFGVF
jgi:hypothetical protein